MSSSERSHRASQSCRKINENVSNQPANHFILAVHVLFSESVPVLFFITAAFCSKGLIETIPTQPKHSKNKVDECEHS